VFRSDRQSLPQRGTIRFWAVHRECRFRTRPCLWNDLSCKSKQRSIAAKAIGNKA